MSALVKFLSKLRRSKAVTPELAGWESQSLDPAAIMNKIIRKEPLPKGAGDALRAHAKHESGQPRAANVKYTELEDWLKKHGLDLKDIE